KSQSENLVNFLMEVFGDHYFHATKPNPNISRTYAVQPIFVIATDREAISNPSFSYLMRKS
ncbi:MAG: hypothetical protein MK289_23925, partial [Trichodesmium sp. ALOHA_ZT_67]|nr:hypothetical protein [Trichodesmium sp. ALOHA_ZT_67]